VRCLSSKSFASLLFTSPSTSALTPLLALRALSLWDSTPLPGLAIHVSDAPEESYDADDQVFVRGNLAIDATGVAMRDQARSFQIAYHELLIGDIIGKGSSSVVLQATHKPTGTPIAMKVISMFEKSKRDQLMREICTLYNASCPSLITFYGAFYREGCITIVLEYMDGGSLSNALSQIGPIPLAYLKREKRLHRDIKPSNLLVNSRGEVKLTDFGVSKELNNSIAMCGTFVGTFKYMAPERVQSLPYSYQADIWSLGLCILELATGRYPYPMDSACIEMVQTILESDAPKPPAGHFSPEFEEFIGVCLNKDPKQRLPAEVLLQSPWLQRNGATSYGQSVANVASWIASMQ
jgi:serine/threonine protein kinase